MLRAILEAGCELCDWLWSDDDDDAVSLDMPMCKQLDGHSCGLEVVRCVLQYFGHRPSRAKLRNMLGTSPRHGTSEDAIQEVLEDFGLGSRVIADGKLSDLRRCIRDGEPVIVTVDEGEHWLVVTGYSTGCISVMDPRPWVLVSQMDSEEFELNWCEGWGIAVSGA
ncbi:MAG: hypothetical protein GY811_12165 [Myxococcales bacterium]|nr:hypothetical protein [Myxococcales bacterium]